MAARWVALLSLAVMLGGCALFSSAGGNNIIDDGNHSSGSRSKPSDLATGGYPAPEARSTPRDLVIVPYDPKPIPVPDGR
jgi:hypothetical protein